MRKGAGKGPPRFGCGVGTLAVNSVVGELALVPASNHLPTPTHTSATTHSPHPAPASVAPPRHTSASVMSCRRLPARHAPARWACAPPRDTPGTPRPCRTHLFPLAKVMVPKPCCLPLSHAPSYLPPHAINTTTAPAAVPVAPPSPRQSWPGARRQAPDRWACAPPRDTPGTPLPTAAASRSLPLPGCFSRVPPQPPAHPPACRTHLSPLV